MKISELSRRSGVPLATIKFYQREHMLPSGEASGPNQASYGEEHLRRLALIRALKDVGGLSLAAIRQIIALIEQPEASTWEVLGTAIDALSDRDRPAPQTEEESQARRQAEEDIERFLGKRGWQVRPEGAAYQSLVDALVALRQVWAPDMPVERLENYAQAAEAIALGEFAYAAAHMRGDATEAVHASILGTVLFEPVILGLRRLAHEHLTNQALQGHLPAPEDPCSG